jgi:hypothetical protein
LILIQRKDSFFLNYFLNTFNFEAKDKAKSSNQVDENFDDDNNNEITSGNNTENPISLSPLSPSLKRDKHSNFDFQGKSSKSPKTNQYIHNN